MLGNRCIDTPGELADFLWAFVRAVGLARPILMGCSVGGDIVLLMAQQHPTDVKALIAFDGADHTARGQSLLLGHPQISIGEYTYDRSMCQVGRLTAADIREFIGWNIRQTAPEAQLADNNVFCTFDVRKDMAQITCPCLLVRGSDDWTVTKPAVEDTLKRLTQALIVDYVELEGAGHWSHQEMPAEGCAAIERFLVKVEGK
jgi:pimeloyl-ACP methyl ester carboxylesterase